MVAKKNTYLLFLFFCWSIIALGQKHLRTEVHFNKNAVFIGEPIEVSVSVYSTTWFTDGVDIGNIQVDGAYTVYFRSLSSTKQINGKQYSGVTFFYNVFPYANENLIFPSLEFYVETPDEGGYKGIRRKVKTDSKTIKVKPIPPNIDYQNWLVSSSVRIYDNWKGNIKKVKVGDVLERQITIKVGNTISQFIPKVHFDTLVNISLYPRRSNLKNNKTKTSISAIRTDATRYLFEKEGDYTIPEINIQWWNPYSHKLFKRVLKSKTIHVEPNPDLGILQSIKDELKATVEKEQHDEARFNYFGLSLKNFLGLCILVLLLSYILIKFANRIYNQLKLKNAVYKDSEAYYFELFIKSLRKQNLQTSKKLLYDWLDQINLTEPTIQYFIKNYGTEYLQNIDKNSTTRLDSLRHRKEWKISRRNYLQNKNRKVQTRESWVNP